MLWNAVGGAGEVTPEVDVARLVAGDTLLLCTDGLTRVLNDESIRAIVAAGSSARAACHGLIDAATSAGAEDDVTLTVARFEEPALNRTDSVSAPAGAATAAADIPRPSGAGPAVAECDVDA
jgi:protein phosphatase